MYRHAAIVVTYFPDTDVIENLERLSFLCDQLIIIDNTSQKDRPSYPKKPNVTVQTCMENVGLAKALNMGMNLAGKVGIENVFLLDQDSRPSNRYFREMLRFKSTFENSKYKYGFYVPNFYDRNSKTFAIFPLLNRWYLRHVTCKNMPIRNEKFALIAITSGMLIDLSQYNEIGPFREDYYIDFIDNEYCLRANRLGFSIAVNCELILDHAVGQRSVKKFLGLTIKPNHHFPVRKYYIFRNGVRTTIEYFRPYPIYAILMIARLTHEILSIFLYESDKLRKTEAILLGTYHGFVGKMGKCPLRRFS